VGLCESVAAAALEHRLVALGIYGVFTALLLPMITYFVT
jgi:hypothetical protein